jgi:hypothetical protein
LRIARWRRSPDRNAACQSQVSRGVECELQNVRTGNPGSLHTGIPWRGRVERPDRSADSPDATGEPD